MNRFRQFVALAILIAFIPGTKSTAQPVVYSNGSIIGNINGWGVNAGAEVTDSFTISSTTSLASVTAGIWDSPGDSVTSLNWAVGSAAFGSDISSGFSATTDQYLFTFSSFGPYDIYSDSFPISGIVAPGTYWLTLSNAVTLDSPAYWDQNNGQSLALVSTDSSTFTIASESFQIHGSQLNGTPEPGAYAMLAGLAMCGLTIARSMRRG